MVAYLVLALLVGLNAWMSVRIRRAPDEHIAHKGLLIATIWLMPFLGALTARNHLRVHVPGEAFKGVARQWDARAVTEPAPVSVDIDSRVLSMDGALDVRDGLPFLDGAAVERWLGALEQPLARRKGLAAVRRAWLLHLRDALGSYRLHEFDGASILSAMQSSVVAQTAATAASARDRVRRVLGGLARPTPDEYILIVFERASDCDRYLDASHQRPRAPAANRAAYVPAALPHFVAARQDLVLLQPALVLERARASLSHLAAPRWLLEGIADSVAFGLNGTHRHTIATVTHQDFWDEGLIQAFWSGAMFDRDDDGRALAEDLARLVVETLRGRQGRDFEQFVVQAAPDDAGALAARDILGIDLGSYVCAVLGLEPSVAWSPTASTVV